MLANLLRNRSTKLIVITGAALATWFLAVEASTEAWYRYKESQVPETQPWNIAFPADAEEARERGFLEFSTRELGETEKEILRFDHALSASWRDPAGNSWSAFILEWQPDNRLNQNDLSHNPTSCLPAAGLKLVSNGPDVPISVGGIEVPFRSWIFRSGNRDLYVFLASRKQLAFEDLELTQDMGRRAVERFVNKPLLGMRGNPLQTVQLFVAGPDSFEAAVELAKIQVSQLETANLTAKDG